MLWGGKGRLDSACLADYALWFRSQSWVQLLGYLVALFSLPMYDTTYKRLLDRARKDHRYLGQPGRWGRGGQ
jgi:hypothetical protein